MHWFWWLLIIFLAVFLLLLFVPLTLYMRYRYTSEQDYLEIQVKIWPGFRYRKTVYNITHFLKKPETKQQKIRKAPEEASQNGHPVFGRRKKWLQLYKSMQPPLLFLLRHTNLSKLRWHTKIGLSDAALTGLAVGWLWCAAGLMLKILNLFIPFFCRPEIFVEPDFNKPSLALLFELTISVRCGFLFLAALQIALSLVRNRNTIKNSF